MKAVKIIWGIIAGIWLASIFIDPFTHVRFSDTAVDAMQRSTEASKTILIIIAVTLLLNLMNENADKSTEQVQQLAKELTAQSKRVADVLDQMQQLIGSFTNSGVPISKVTNKVEQTNSDISPQAESTTTIIPDNHLCPKCHVPMIIQTATKGESQGKQFYVCPNYKQCQQFFPVE